MKGDDARAKNRPEHHIPMHKQRGLHAFEREGWKRRVVLDKPGRIDQFKLAGWTVVQQDGLNIDQNASQLGSAVSQIVNWQSDAIAKHAYLMEIPEEWYNEDQLLKQREITSQMDGMTTISDNPNHQYGEIKY